jgi:predicted amidohydrolase
MDPYVVKFIEVLLMQLLVFGAVAAILVAAVWDIVRTKVAESRHSDLVVKKARAPKNRSGLFARNRIANPFAHHHA